MPTNPYDINSIPGLSPEHRAGLSLNPEFTPMYAQRYAPQRAQAPAPQAPINMTPSPTVSPERVSGPARTFLNDQQAQQQKRAFNASQGFDLGGWGGTRARKYFKRFQAFYPLYLQQFEAQRQKASDMAALGEQTQLQGIGAQAGRSGLSGSGIEDWARWSATGQRQALDQAALQDQYQQALQAAMESAGQTGRHWQTQVSQRHPSPWPQYMQTAGTIATLAALSDSRLKTDIKPLRPVTWTWKQRAKDLGLQPGASSTGLIAQDVEKVWPDAVVEQNGYKAVNYPLVAARLTQLLKRREAHA